MGTIMLAALLASTSTIYPQSPLSASNNMALLRSKLTAQQNLRQQYCNAPSPLSRHSQPPRLLQDLKHADFVCNAATVHIRP